MVENEKINQVVNILPEEIDWEGYREYLEERIEGLNRYSHNPDDERNPDTVEILELEIELDMISEEEYFEVINNYDEEYWEQYKK